MISKTSVRPTLILFALLAASTALAGPANPPGTLAISAQPLSQALTQFARTSGLQIVYVSKVTSGIWTHGAPGNLSPRETLRKLLQGTGLTFKFTNATTVTIIRRSGISRRDGSPGAHAHSEKTTPPTAGNQVPPDVSTTYGETRKTTDVNHTNALHEVVVTGTRIPGHGELSVPIKTISRAEIVRSGATTIQSVMETVPENSSEFTTGLIGANGLSSLDNQNYAAASAVSLFGLGPQSTLTLVNGQRRAGTANGRVVDISTIPISLVDHIDILTGGASAIYGSDAVAGVVNIVLRRQFNGAETSVTYSDPDVPGGARYDFSQIFGISRNRGGFLVAVDASKTQSVNIVRTNIPIYPTSQGIVPKDIDEQPNDHKFTLYGSGQYRFTSKILGYFDLSYFHGKTDYASNFSIPVFNYLSTEDTNTVTDQLNFDAGSLARLPGQWSLKTSVDYSEVRNTERAIGKTIFGGLSVPYLSGGRNRSGLSAATVVAQGPLYRVFSHKARVAVGISYRHENQHGISLQAGTNAGLQSRNVYSAFGELHSPLAPEDLLELLLAVRYDHYSDVGSTTNPQIGLVWKAIGNQLKLRATFAKSFRAPALFSRNNLSSSATIQYLPDPLSSSGSSLVLLRQGDNTRLKPETAKSWNAGLDFIPNLAPWLSASLNYFSITYSNRIDAPASGPAVFAALENASQYGSLINRHPNAAELNQIVQQAVFFNNDSGIPFNPSSQDVLSSFPAIILFNDELANIATDRVRGVSISARGHWHIGIGSLVAHVTTIHYLTYYRRLLPSLPKITGIDVPGKPTKTRVRASLGWRHEWFTGTAYLNYVSSYTDPFVTPIRDVASWTTIDASVQANLLKVSMLRFPARLTLAVRNLTGARPPAVYSNSFGAGYDGVNANPFGRIVVAEMTVKW